MPFRWQLTIPWLIRQLPSLVRPQIGQGFCGLLGVILKRFVAKAIWLKGAVPASNRVTMTTLC